MIKLHDFARSSASARVRIALNLKGLPYERVIHDLDAGAHWGEAYRSLNPQGLLPSLEIDGLLLTQSLSIIEYLDGRYDSPQLIPKDRILRARVVGLFQLLAADTHPITTMRVTQFLRDELHLGDAQIRRWQHHWIKEGFDALEAYLVRSTLTGRFSHGDAPCLSDIALVPQVVSARRQGLDIDDWPTIARICVSAFELPAFERAFSQNQ